jgi:hypothetical protein
VSLPLFDKYSIISSSESFWLKNRTIIRWLHNYDNCGSVNFLKIILVLDIAIPINKFFKFKLEIAAKILCVLLVTFLNECHTILNKKCHSLKETI